MNTDPSLSAQPCGCDPGAKHICQWHCDLVETRMTDPITVCRLPDPQRGLGGAPTRETTLPDDPTLRKQYPVGSGVLDYFPDALVAIAHVSWQGNNQHNPGQPLHWAREKSTDESDAVIRHYLRRGTLDTDGQRHSAKMAWRALAFLQKEIEEERKG